MLKELDNYDWAEVFGEGSGGNCTPITPGVPIGDTTTVKSTFCREDVTEICGQIDGENDGPDWVIWGRLRDGRWFTARGGCDYTGWDCQATNSGDVASRKEDLIRFCMTLDERKRFGVLLPDDSLGE